MTNQTNEAAVAASATSATSAALTDNTRPLPVIEVVAPPCRPTDDVEVDTNLGNLGTHSANNDEAEALLVRVGSNEDEEEEGGMRQARRRLRCRKQAAASDRPPGCTADVWGQRRAGLDE